MNIIEELANEFNVELQELLDSKGMFHLSSSKSDDRSANGANELNSHYGFGIMIEENDCIRFSIEFSFRAARMEMNLSKINESTPFGQLPVEITHYNYEDPEFDAKRILQYILD